MPNVADYMGVNISHQPSRFIQEIPNEFLDAVRPKAKISRPTQYNDDHFNTRSFNRESFRKVRQNAGQDAGDTGLKIGQRVHHKKFGAGIILNYEGHSEHTRVQVKFDNAGTKWLVASYANLESV